MDRVAAELGEDADYLFNLAIEMETEDGVIWVYGLDDDDGVMALTEFGIENLRQILQEDRKSKAR